MLRDAAVDLLMGRLGKRTSAITQQDIINEMVFAQGTILEGNPTLYWFLLSEDSYASTTADDERLALPDDFLQEWEYGALYYIDDDGNQAEFVRDDYDVIKKRVIGTGRPEYYDIAGDYFFLRKIPDDAYTIWMRYYQKQADISGTYGDGNNIENGWLKWASDLLIAETGIIIAQQYLQSDTMVKLFIGQKQVAEKRLIDKNTAMQETNKQRFMEG